VIIIIKGTATVEVGKKETKVAEGNAFFIKEGKEHNVKNNGKQPLEYIYVVNLLS
jgi:mannose-6-phosphate isomerase-like protein (cupin superfamily)